MMLAIATERSMLRDCLNATRASATVIETVMRRMTTLRAIARLAEFLLAHPTAEESEILAHAS